MDQEHLERMARLKESREQEEKAYQATEQELVRCTMEAGAAREAESPPRDENNEALDYCDDVDQDTEMASSQETVLMSSQDTTPASSQKTVPMSSQESKATAPVSSQESMTQETSMPSLETAMSATILDAADEAPMEDETCLEGPMLKCTP